MKVGPERVAAGKTSAENSTSSRKKPLTRYKNILADSMWLCTVCVVKHRYLSENIGKMTNSDEYRRAKRE